LKYKDGGNDLSIEDSFSDDALMMLDANTPWYADIANYLVGKELPPGLLFHQKKKFLHDVKFFL